MESVSNSAPRILECREVSRQLVAFPQTLLLDRVSFTLRKAEVLTVLGPSGAGKSTLLRLLNRLDELTGGAILLDGEDHRSISPRSLRRRVGMIMQRAFLFPGTVAENVCFGPSQHGTTVAKWEIEELLEQVGLAGYMDRNVATLSGGEAQRVAITRALANAPEVLLLDEPTSALDQVNKQSVEALLESLVRKRGLACIWVTHDEAQAARVADSVLLLEGGRVKAFGAARDVLQTHQGEAGYA